MDRVTCAWMHMSVSLILSDNVAFHSSSEFYAAFCISKRARFDWWFRSTRLSIVRTRWKSRNSNFQLKSGVLSFSFSNKADPKRSTVSVSLGNLLAKVSGPVESLFLMESAYIQTNSVRRILPGLTSPGTYFSIINKKSEFIIYQITQNTQHGFRTVAKLKNIPQKYF